MQKKKITQLKTFFIIINLIIGVVAFSEIISAAFSPDWEEKSESFSSSPLPTRGRCEKCGAVLEKTLGGESLEKAKPSTSAVLKEYFTKKIFEDFFIIMAWTGLGALIGSLAGGEKGEIWGAISGLSGAVAYTLSKHFLLHTGKEALFGTSWLTPGVFGIGVSLIVFALTYKKTSVKTVEFKCQPYEPPVGGKYCELCNEFEECSEYTCKSLGQACELVNKGTEHEKCIWANPHDVISPTIEVRVLTKGLTTVPFRSIRPPATGVEIKPIDGKCIKAFTPFEFVVLTDEPSQCKIDYNLTSFEGMSYYVGNNFFDYNHTEKMSLPGPDAINKVAPELKNDGVYTLFTICQDANGNKNENAYAIRFCVEPGPDLTAPVIEDTSIPSGSPIQYNKTSLELEVYVNEPAECKWSKQDVDYDLMENEMDCDIELWEMNSENTYTCRVTLEGIESRKENLFYFRCKDQPYANESDRNENTRSFEYVVQGTQPLNILEAGPNETIKGATDTIPVFLRVKTDNGYKNGEATCYYALTENEEDYIEFLNTGTNEHEQRQDLPAGDYRYYIKCVDLGGNAAYTSISFRVESDREAPKVVRAYKESGELKIITNEKAECSYSFKDCNFEIDDGIKMRTIDFKSHNAEWKAAKKYYIRCKDKYNNQPNPNSCSIIIRAFEEE